MELCSLKIKRKGENKGDTPTSLVSESENVYNYGTSLHFSTEEVDKIQGIDTLQVGDRILVLAKAEITEVSANATITGAERSVRIQITDFGFEREVDLGKLAPKEYRAARGK